MRCLTQQLAPLFLKQGFSESSSEGPFEDYLVQGIGKAPMVMVYQSQFLARAAANDGSITPDMELVYPEPTILSKHTFVSLSSVGQRLGQFLNDDPGIRQLATEIGFRTPDTNAFRTFVERPSADRARHNHRCHRTTNLQIARGDDQHTSRADLRRGRGATGVARRQLRTVTEERRLIPMTQPTFDLSSDAPVEATAPAATEPAPAPRPRPPSAP